MTRKLTQWIVLLAWLLTLPLGVSAFEPTKTVEGVVHTAPGGGSDILARAIAEKSRTTICPESIFPGYSLDVVEVSEVTEVAVKRIVLPHRLTEVTGSVTSGT